MDSSTPDRALLVKFLLEIRTELDMENFLEEIFSPAEIRNAAHRIHTAKALLTGATYRDIEKNIGSSTYMINRAKRTIVQAKTGIIITILKKLGELEEA